MSEQDILSSGQLPANQEQGEDAQAPKAPIKRRPKPVPVASPVDVSTSGESTPDTRKNPPKRPGPSGQERPRIAAQVQIMDGEVLEKLQKKKAAKKAAQDSAFPPPPIAEEPVVYQSVEVPSVMATSAPASGELPEQEPQSYAHAEGGGDYGHASAASEVLAGVSAGEGVVSLAEDVGVELAEGMQYSQEAIQRDFAAEAEPVGSAPDQEIPPPPLPPVSDNIFLSSEPYPAQAVPPPPPPPPFVPVSQAQEEPAVDLSSPPSPEAYPDPVGAGEAIAAEDTVTAEEAVAVMEAALESGVTMEEVAQDEVAQDEVLFSVPQNEDFSPTWQNVGESVAAQPLAEPQPLLEQQPLPEAQPLPDPQYVDSLSEEMTAAAYPSEETTLPPAYAEEQSQAAYVEEQPQAAYAEETSASFEAVSEQAVEQSPEQEVSEPVVDYEAAPLSEEGDEQLPATEASEQGSDLHVATQAEAEYPVSAPVEVSEAPASISIAEKAVPTPAPVEEAEYAAPISVEVSEAPASIPVAEVEAPVTVAEAAEAPAPVVEVPAVPAEETIAGSVEESSTGGDSQEASQAAGEREAADQEGTGQENEAVAASGTETPENKEDTVLSADSQQGTNGDIGANGKPRIRIPWDDSAQDEEFGDSDAEQPYQEKDAASLEEERPRNADRRLSDEATAAFDDRSLSFEKKYPSSTRIGGSMNGGVNGGTNGGRIPPPGAAGDKGAWLWLPKGVEQRLPWRSRHPILFWGVILLFCALVFNAGRLSMSGIPFVGSKLAVINLEGVILDSESVVKWIDRIAMDDSYKGALLRINSPGGAVGPSQEIYAAVKRLDARKPVVASLGTLAASGGYYAALGAREIVAGPSTITGSVGIKMQVPNMEGLMRTLGVSERTLVSGAYKDAGSMWRQMSQEEEEYFYGIMDDMYEEFVGVIAHERKISMADMARVADGKAMTGRQAMLLKLVDALGDRQEALARLKAHCRIDENTILPLVEGPRSQVGFLKELLLSLVNMLQEQKSVHVQPMFLY